MCFHVAVQRRLHCKTLPTFITLVGPFACVDPDMPEKCKSWSNTKDNKEKGE